MLPAKHGPAAEAAALLCAENPDPIRHDVIAKTAKRGGRLLKPQRMWMSQTRSWADLALHKRRISTPCVIGAVRNCAPRCQPRRSTPSRPRYGVRLRAPAARRRRTGAGAARNQDRIRTAGDQAREHDSQEAAKCTSWPSATLLLFTAPPQEEAPVKPTAWGCGWLTDAPRFGLPLGARIPTAPSPCRRSGPTPMPVKARPVAHSNTTSGHATANSEPVAKWEGCAEWPEATITKNVRRWVGEVPKPRPGTRERRPIG